MKRDFQQCFGSQNTVHSSKTIFSTFNFSVLPKNFHLIELNYALRKLINLAYTDGSSN